MAVAGETCTREEEGGEEEEEEDEEEEEECFICNQEEKYARQRAREPGTDSI